MILLIMYVYVTDLFVINAQTVLRSFPPFSKKTGNGIMSDGTTVKLVYGMYLF